ncbi:MAG: glucan biosynthesis protein [Opitutaceae bacterium]|nr:glucan biosynthesis protein [Opitutaceae bacterium]
MKKFSAFFAGTLFSLTIFAQIVPSALASAGIGTGDGGAFSFETLQARARGLAAAPYKARESRVPAALQKLDYDQHRDIRFDPARALWRAEKLPFQLQFFHPGFIQRHTVQIHEVAGGRARLIPFDQELFDYGKNTGLGGAIPAGMGFSGLRVSAPLNSRDHFDELVVFQGASYFRALPRGARYGLSARGLALNTAEPGGEEFPMFEEFWVGRPAPGAREIVIYALLDSPGAAGAYQFSIAPGDNTVARVSAVLFLRDGAGENIKVFGVAPLTSMFWFGENSPGRFEDLRPEVHDSDGLALHTGAGEWIWRPLDNPRAVRASAFADENPRGFGLAQRDRAFASYEDIEAAYHLRPSAWVEPVGDWGRGEVRLVEIPTPDETNDNIVAFWAPAQLPPAGRPLALEYRLHWHTGGAAVAQPPGGRVIATRQGRSQTHEPGLRRFWVDFDGGALAELPAGATGVEAVVTVGDGARLVHSGVEKNPFNRTWRAAFAIKPDGSGRPVELRCFLRDDAAALTETWSYLWNE